MKKPSLSRTPSTDLLPNKVNDWVRDASEYTKKAKHSQFVAQHTVKYYETKFSEISGFNPLKHSIIIPTYNRCSLLVAAVESVIAIDYRPIELIIIDDGSTDSTPSYLKNLHEQLKSSSQIGIRCLSQPNLGPQTARNNGLNVATGDTIQFLDSDDVLYNDGVVRILRCLTSNPTLDYAYGLVQRVKDNLQPTEDALIGSDWHGCKRLFSSYHWHTMAAIYRSDFLEKTPRWHSNVINGDDWLFQCRIKMASRNFAFVPVVIGYWRQHQGARLASGRFDLSHTRRMIQTIGIINDETLASDCLSKYDQFRLQARALRHVFELEYHRHWQAAMEGWKICSRISSYSPYSKVLTQSTMFLPVSLRRFLFRWILQGA